MNDVGLNSELEFRKSVEYDSRFEKRITVYSYYGYGIVERNGWKGVISDGKLLVPSYYDKVEIICAANVFCAVVSIEDKKGLYVLSSRYEPVVLDCIYDEIKICTSFKGVALIKNGKEGLFSLNSMRLLFPCEFDCVSLNVDAYAAWGRKNNNSIEFIVSATGEHIYQSGARKAYETESHILFEDNDGLVRLLNDNGYIDRYAFRRLVVDAGGRLILSNSRELRSHICDISGYVIS